MMINEILFLAHLSVVSGCTLLAFKRGKTALTAWVCLQAVLANLFVIKQICLFGAHVTCSEPFAIGILFSLNLLREYFGKETAKKALHCCFLLMGFFVILSQIHLFYQPSPYDTAQEAYQLLLAPSARLLLASLVTFYVVQGIDLKLFHFIKTRLGQLSFPWRNALCTTSSQALDTALFSFLGLFGLVSHLMEMMTMSFLLKVTLIIFMSPLLALCRRYRPLKEIS